MAFVDFISEQPGGFSRFPLQAPHLVSRPPGGLSLTPQQPTLPPPPQLPSAIAPPQPAPMFHIRPPAFCPRCYSQFNASFALGGLCPNCSCTISQLAAIRPPPPAIAVPRPLTAPIMQPHLQQKEVAPIQTRTLPPNHGYHQQQQDPQDSTVDRFMMTNMLHVIDDVLKEQDEKSDMSLPLTSGSSPVDLSPQVMTAPAGIMSFQNNIGTVYANGEMIPTTMISEMTRSVPQTMPSVRLCQCGNEHIVYCSDCHDYLCCSCILNHEKNPILKNHKILDTLKISVSASLGIAPPVTTSSAFIPPPPKNDVMPVINEDNIQSCLQHTSEKCSLFCHTCVKMVCKSCAITDHPHHMYMSLMEAYIRYRPTVEQLVSKAQVEINLLDLSLTGAEKMMSSVVVKQKEAVDRVKEIFQEHREVLAKREQEVSVCVCVCVCVCVRVCVR